MSNTLLPHPSTLVTKEMREEAVANDVVSIINRFITINVLKEIVKTNMVYNHKTRCLEGKCSVETPFISTPSVKKEFIVMFINTMKEEGYTAFVGDDGVGMKELAYISWSVSI